MFCNKLPPGSKHCSTQTAVTKPNQTATKAWLGGMPSLGVLRAYVSAGVEEPAGSHSLPSPFIHTGLSRCFGECSRSISAQSTCRIQPERSCSKDSQRQTVEISETVATSEQGAKAGMWGFGGVFSMEIPGRCLAWKHPSEGQVWSEGPQ